MQEPLEGMTHVVFSARLIIVKWFGARICSMNSNVLLIVHLGTKLDVEKLNAGTFGG